MAQLKRVVIIGGGFGGLMALKELSEYNYHFEITLIDKNDYAILKPKLTSIVAGKEVENIKVLIPPILREYEAIWEEDEVDRIVPNENRVYTKGGGVFNYDYLIISSGIEFDYGEYVDSDFYDFTSLESATLLKNEIDSFNGENINIFIMRDSFYDGAAVEAAFLIKEKLEDDKKDIKISLITQDNLLFPQIGEESRNFLIDKLKEKDIEVKHLLDIRGEEGLKIILPSFKMPSFIEKSNLKTDKNGVVVDGFMRVEGVDNIFVIGDLSNLSVPKIGHNAFKSAKVAVGAILEKEKIENKKENFEKDILSIIEVDNLKAILIYSNRYFGGDIDFAIESILAKELKIVFKNSLYFSLGELPAKLDEGIKKLIEKYFVK